MKQIPLAIGPEASHTFDSFFTGANGLAVEHLKSLAHTGEAGPPVYLWGPAGSGKTHLLRAAAAQWQRQGRRVAWFDADAPLPWQPPGPHALVVLDDCGRYDAQRQHAAFTLFVEAAATSAQVAAAGRVPPVDLLLRDDLRTRLGWGHVFAVEPLSEAQTRAALRREADRRGLLLTDELMDYLLNHFDRDLKHLTDRLDALDHYALSHKRALSVPLLRQMLAEADE
jgi:DnaA family protein